MPLPATPTAQSSFSRSFAASRAVAGSVVLEARRGRVAWLLALVLAIGFALSELLASVAITESRHIASGTFGAWVRLGSVFVIGLYVVNSMVRDRVDKGLQMVLSLPVARASYIAGRLLGYAACALVTAAICGLAVTVYAPSLVALAWGLTLFFELLLVVTMAVLCVLTLSQVPLAMCALMGFYLLARSMQTIQLIASNPLLGWDGPYGAIVEDALTAIGWLLPDLHRFAPAQWLIAPTDIWSEVASLSVHAAIYLLLLVAAALFDMERKVL